MALTRVLDGNTMNATDVNQLVNVFQCPAGQTEVGKYFLTFNAQATNAVGSLYMPLHNRFSIPVSVTIDSADAAATNCNAPSTGQFTLYGFQIYSFSTSENGNCRVAGNWTVSF